jgi:hypothetical protein
VSVPVGASRLIRTAVVASREITHFELRVLSPPRPPSPCKTFEDLVFDRESEQSEGKKGECQPRDGKGRGRDSEIKRDEMN